MKKDKCIRESVCIGGGLLGARSATPPTLFFQLVFSPPLIFSSNLIFIAADSLKLFAQSASDTKINSRDAQFLQCRQKLATPDNPGVGGGRGEREM